MTDIPHIPLIIIGAGFSGLGAAIQLSRLQSFTAYEHYEKADFVGGTWYSPRLTKVDSRLHNTYRTLYYGGSL